MKVMLWGNKYKHAELRLELTTEDIKLFSDQSPYH